jgi:hypothetical protein
MGQYYAVVNLDKKEYIFPHRFCDGLKLLEFGCSASGTMTGLALLLADGNGRGGGDIRSDSTLIGSWAGDRIVITGDYADEGKFISEEDYKAWYESNEKAVRKMQPGESKEDYRMRVESWEDRRKSAKRPNLYQLAEDLYEDVSYKILLVMAEDSCLRADIVKAIARYDFGMSERLDEIKNKKVRAGISKLLSEAKKLAAKEKTEKEGAGDKALRPDMILTFPKS